MFFHPVSLTNATMLSEGMKNKLLWTSVFTKNFTQQDKKPKKLQSESFYLVYCKSLSPSHLQSCIHGFFTDHLTDIS